MLTGMRFSHVIAGFIAVLVGYAGSAAIIFQASAAAGATPEQASSWMLALGVGCAISSFYLSVRHKTPVLTAWSTPGAALLVVALPGTSLEQAIGAFIFCGVLLWLTGITGWFEKLATLIPDALANAMLAGVLAKFGVGIFTSIQMSPILVAIMGVVYLVSRRWAARFAILCVLSVGLLAAIFLGEFNNFDQINVALAKPIWVMPEFNLSVLIGIGLPLYLVTMSSQNMAGVAVLRGAGYRPPISSSLSVTGGVTAVLAPFGGFAFNLAAITAAICAGAEAGDDPKTRYWAPVVSALMYLLLGLFGTTVIGFFLAAPEAFVAALAGLALLPVIGASLNAALSVDASREAALVTFLTTVSGISFFGIASPVWALLFGSVAWLLARK